MFSNLSLAAVGLLTTGAAASGITALERGAIPLSSPDVLEKRYVDVSSDHRVVRRQRPQFESTVTLNQDGTIDMEAWDQETESACQENLKRLMIASNPSGACICYNLPTLDMESGVFEADLRVYRFNEPSGDFEGIAPEDIEVALMYDGASVSPVEPGEMPNLNPARRKRQEVDGGGDGAPDLPLLQQYLLVGQIDDGRLTDDMTMLVLHTQTQHTQVIVQ